MFLVLVWSRLEGLDGAVNLVASDYPEMSPAVIDAVCFFPSCETACLVVFPAIGIPRIRGRTDP
jgi:hypothetical protein